MEATSKMAVVLSVKSRHGNLTESLAELQDEFLKLSSDIQLLFTDDISKVTVELTAAIQAIQIQREILMKQRTELLRVISSTTDI